MIKFNILDSNESQRIFFKYPEMLEYEVDYSIIIDGKTFFYEPNFPVLEFIYQVKEWKNSQPDSFEYNSLETDDNPLITFKYNNGLFSISSPWQKFQCDNKYTKDELVAALSKITTIYTN